MNKESYFLSIVIPAYNEGSRIQQLSSYFESTMQSAPFSWELIIVDDGSKQNLQETVLKQVYFQDLYAKGVLKIFRHETNKGKGATIETGVKHSNGKFILTIDADLSTTPDQVFLWLENLKNSREKQVFIGSREHKDSIVIDQIGRRVTGRVFNFLIRIFLPIKLKDTQCGFKLYPASIAKEVIANLHEKGWAHDLEIILKLQHRKISVLEMPIKWNASEDSKISLLKDSFKMFLSLLLLSYMNSTEKIK